jgi:hypothetical protein
VPGWWRCSERCAECCDARDSPGLIECPRPDRREQSRRHGAACADGRPPPLPGKKSARSDPSTRGLEKFHAQGNFDQQGVSNHKNIDLCISTKIALASIGTFSLISQPAKAGQYKI